MHLILVSSWNCFNYLYIFFLFYAPYDVWYIYMIWVQCSSIYPFINDSLSICLKLATKLFYSQDNWCKVQGGISCSSSWCNLPFCWFDWSKPAHIIVHLIFSFLLNCFITIFTFFFYIPYDVWYIYIKWVQCFKILVSIYPFINDFLDLSHMMVNWMLPSSRKSIQTGSNCYWWNW